MRFVLSITYEFPNCFLGMFTYGDNHIGAGDIRYRSEGFYVGKIC